jgi:hypothetical protein
MSLRHVHLVAAAAVAAPVSAETDPSAARGPTEIVVNAPTPLSDVGREEPPTPAQTASDEEIEAAHASPITSSA